MDARGADTHVIYKNDSGAEERLHLKDVSISYDDPDAGKRNFVIIYFIIHE